MPKCYQNDTFCYIFKDQKSFLEAGEVTNTMSFQVPHHNIGWRHIIRSLAKHDGHLTGDGTMGYHPYGSEGELAATSVTPLIARQG